MISRVLVALVGLFTLTVASACAQERYGEVYDPEVEAAAVIDAALSRAQARDVPSLLVFGANWCHDSRGLAHRLETDEALSAFVVEDYELVFVDVGERDRNLDQMARFGVNHIFGTPTLVIATAEGGLLNAESVHHWRTVDNAGTADLGAYLARFAQTDIPVQPQAYADLEAVVNAWPAYQDAIAALQSSEFDDQSRAVRAAYYEGFARSMARLTLGNEARDQGMEAADSANLREIDPALDDLTERVIERLSARDPDLVSRGNRELERYEDALKPED